VRNAARVGIGPIIVLAILAAIPAVGLGVLWRWADARVPDPQAEEVPVAEPTLPAPLTTPILSVRRAPQTLASLSSDGDLVTALTALGAFVNDTSCIVVQVDGRTIFDRNGDVPVTPASNEKLITGAVALEVLGPDFTYSTKLLGTVADGVVTGDLFMLGGGDPLLSTADDPPTVATDPPTNTTSLETLVGKLVAAGVTRVQGNVVGDESRYDAERFVPSWPSDIPNTEAGPLSALMVNDATRKFAPPGGAPTRYADPATGAATDLIRLLKAAGITVGGGAKAFPTPAGTPEIASVESAPMSAIVGEMLTTSDDNTAELLLKELAVHADNIVGTRADGIDVIDRVLLTWGIDTTKVAPTDGSGLDSANVVTCNILLQVLLHQPLDSPLGLGADLATAGQTGTLADQFLDSPVVGRLHAKTGTLSNAKALTGYVTTTAGTLDFSMVLGAQDVSKDANGPGTAPYIPFWTQLAAALGAYPSGPGLEVLQPR
jgi:D-alanyl-D-alanine carboxypeptidase/D-alanyl-D-alanine-endopeptidase (penicillin-binding protein 4)